MKNWKDTTTIEISTPDGRTTGPIPAKQFSERVKEGLKKMAKGKPKTIDRGQDARKVTPEYWRDPQLEEIAADLIKKHHNHLFDAEISYRVTSKPMSRAGKAIAGKARKASGLLKHFADADFIVIVSDIFWNKMDPPARRAVVDHELCHCSVEYDEDGELSWILMGHDVEEFTKIIDGHGLWHEGLKPFSQAVARQLELPLAEGKAQNAKRHEQSAESKPQSL